MIIQAFLRSLGAGTVTSVTGTQGITVDNTNPAAPIVKLPYKVYRATLTQTGTNDPVATILENTLGEVPTPAYNDVGKYILQTVGAVFTANKTALNIAQPGANDVSDAQTTTAIKRDDTQNIRIITRTFNPNTPLFEGANDVLLNTLVEIFVYP